MGWRLVCCALLLFASARIFAGEQVLTSLSADAWVTGDLMRQMLVIHQPPPTAPIQIRVPNALRVDLNVDAAALCGRGVDNMWHMDLLSGNLVRVDIPMNTEVDRPRVAATRSGCGTPTSDTTLLVLDKFGGVKTIELILPQGMSEFSWRSFAYDDNNDAYLATGAAAYAVIPASSVPGSAPVKMVAGEVAHGSIKDTHFSGFMCCARLSGDGTTLFSKAKVGDNDMSAFAGLIAIEASTGRYKRMYLPFSPVWHETGRHISRLGHPWIDLYGSDEDALWSQYLGSKLVIQGVSDFELRNDVPSLLTIDVESGAVLAVPEMKSEIFEGVSQSGKYTLWRNKQDQTVVRDARSQEVVSQNDYRLIAVAHARNADVRVNLGAIASQNPRAYRSDRALELGIYAQLSKIAAWIRRAKTLHELRSMLLFTEFNVSDPASGRRTSMLLGEVVVYAQSQPLPRPELTMPQLDNSTSEEDEQAWHSHTVACDSFAQAQGDASQLALLRCLVEPW